MSFFNLSGGVKKTDFELLCPDGLRRSVDDYLLCNWGEVPTHAVVASSAKTVQERLKYQDFLRVSMTTRNKTPESYFKQ